MRSNDVGLPFSPSALWGGVYPPRKGGASTRSSLRVSNSLRWGVRWLPWPVMLFVCPAFACLHLPRWFHPFVLVLLTGAARAATVESSHLPTAAPLTTTAEVIHLSSAEASRGLPVHLTGVVLFINPRDHAFVVHDEKGAIYVHPTSPALETLRRGDQVEVIGATHPGRFAPVVKPASCVVVGTAPIPPARRVAFSQLMSGAYDGQWVEVSGVVRSVTPLPDASKDALVELVSEELRLPLRFHGTPFPTARNWIDSEITARGVCFHFYNKKGQLFDAQLAVPEGETYRIEAPPAPNPYLLSVRPLSSLLRYDPQGTDPHRVHLRGAVTYVKPGYFFFLQEGKNGIQVHTRQEAPPIGEVLDVVGFAKRGAYGPTLEDAAFKRAGIQEIVTPQRASFREALEADGDLLTIEGRLVNSFWEPEECVLLVQVAEFLIRAHLPFSEKAKTELMAENGGLIALTGVCRTVMGSAAQSQWRWAPQSFELLLRSPADLAVLAPAPWWTSSRVLRVALVGLSLVAAISVVFFLLSRRRIREQRQNRLAAEGQFAAVFQERNRVAREIHDTLAQGLTGISVQIEMAKERLSTPPAALQHLEIARTLVRSSLTEARRTVWGLRPQICENQDLCSALREIAHQLTAGTGISVQVTASPTRFHLPPALESDLLRIGQEAITNAVKHAQPRTIGVELHVTPEAAELRVIDDGCGGAVAAATAPLHQTGPRPGLGVTGMRERAKHLHGHFTLNDRPEGGTELRLRVPLSSR